MRPLLLLSILFCVLLSCNNRPPAQQPAPDTPEALQEKKSGGIDLSLSKSRYDREDLVESLYDELVDKTPELKDIEERIDYLSDAKTDSVKDFNFFDQKNNSYYGSANAHADRITDSLLRDRIRSIITVSQAKYKAQIKRHTDLVEFMDSKSVKLGDLHIVLKLVKTLTMIEKHQKDNIPSAKPIEQVIREYDKTIQKVDSLSKK
jgi:hypothetical protein